MRYLIMALMLISFLGPANAQDDLSISEISDLLKHDHNLSKIKDAAINDLVDEIMEVQNRLAHLALVKSVYQEVYEDFGKNKSFDLSSFKSKMRNQEKVLAFIEIGGYSAIAAFSVRSLHNIYISKLKYLRNMVAFPAVALAVGNVLIDSKTGLLQIEPLFTDTIFDFLFGGEMVEKYYKKAHSLNYKNISKEVLLSNEILAIEAQQEAVGQKMGDLIHQLNNLYPSSGQILAITTRAKIEELKVRVSEKFENDNYENY
ncbi:MAG: hypothetical protein AB8E15_05285 [Bdellovibrionales bacterium]